MILALDRSLSKDGLARKKSCDYEQARYVQVKFYWSKLIMYIVSNL